MNPHPRPVDDAAPDALELTARELARTSALSLDEARQAVYPRTVVVQGKRQGLARRQATIRAAVEAVEVANPGASLAELERQAVTGNRAQRRRAEQALARVERKALRR